MRSLFPPALSTPLKVQVTNLAGRGQTQRYSSTGAAVIRRQGTWITGCS